MFMRAKNLVKTVCPGMEKKPGGCVLPNVVLIWKAWVVLFYADAVGAAVVAADASNQINK